MRKQNEHESATRESNPILLAKASQKTWEGAIRLITVKRSVRPAAGPGPTIARGAIRSGRDGLCKSARSGRSGLTDFPRTRLREQPHPRRPRFDDCARRRKARTNGARIAGGANRPGRDGSRTPPPPLRSSISDERVKGTAPTPGGPGPATARGGGKREQTARES